MTTKTLSLICTTISSGCAAFGILKNAHDILCIKKSVNDVSDSVEELSDDLNQHGENIYELEQRVVSLESKIGMLQKDLADVRSGAATSNCFDVFHTDKDKNTEVASESDK